MELLHNPSHQPPLPLSPALSPLPVSPALSHLPVSPALSPLPTLPSQLKQAIKSQYPDKVFTTDFVPRHSNNLGAVDTEASRRPAGMVAPDAEYTDANITAAATNATSTTIEKDKQEEARLELHTFAGSTAVDLMLDN
ncbi:unnamed protein product [Closterium sp. Naga37s-1]|nr:unnamed protein product [Closterium sp. Naga37s-1]